MYGTALSLMDQKLIWIAQCQFTGQVEYYRINDPFKMQQMLNDVLKVYIYGYIKDISHKLDPVAELWNPEMDQNIDNNKDKKTKENDQEK